MISIEIIDEKNNPIRILGVDFSIILGGALHRISNFEEKYTWLSTIDPYGNTIFNPLQLRCVIDELKQLKEDLLNSAVKKKPFRTNYPDHLTEELVLKNLKELISDLKLDIHQYLKLVGD